MPGRKRKRAVGDHAPTGDTVAVTSTDEATPSYCEMNVAELTSYLKQRDIQTSGKRKPELINLAVKANEIGLTMQDSVENISEYLNMKLTLPSGQVIPRPDKITNGFKCDLRDSPKKTFQDMYQYLVDKEGYDHESLKGFKGLEGYRLYDDGHVETLQYHPLPKVDGYCAFRFQVKPTQ